MFSTSLLLFLSPIKCLAFTSPLSQELPYVLHHKIRQRDTRVFNWFQGISDAFKNDEGLSDDVSDGQVDYDGFDGDNSEQVRRRSSAVALKYFGNANSGAIGAPITDEKIAGTQCELKLYLTGVPDKDPNNNLYGSKVNISSRKDSRVGVGVNIPDEPTVIVQIGFLENGVCEVLNDSPFADCDSVGQWRLFDGNLLRVGFLCRGYQRTVGITGTLSKVFWSDGDEVKTEASSTYSIPPGFIYADCKVKYGRPGEIIIDTNASDKSDTVGLLRVEQKVGLVGSKMLPCGVFDGNMIQPELG